MKYNKITIGDKSFWYADPANWEELKVSLEEGPFLTFDPDNVPDNSDILSKF